MADYESPLLGSSSSASSAARTCWRNPRGAWTLGKKRKANVQWENQRSHYTDQCCAYHISRGRGGKNRVLRGDEEKAGLANTGRIFFFIVIMTWQWNLEGRKALVAPFLLWDLETPWTEIVAFLRFKLKWMEGICAGVQWGPWEEMEPVNQTSISDKAVGLATRLWSQL